MSICVLFVYKINPHVFFNDTATAEIYTLSLHDALPICERRFLQGDADRRAHLARLGDDVVAGDAGRSEEHTSELQSRRDLVCRLLLEKKKHKTIVKLLSLDAVT